MLILDDLVLLDEGDLVVDHSAALLLCHDVCVLEDGYFYSHGRCQFPG